MENLKTVNLKDSLVCQVRAYQESDYPHIKNILEAANMFDQVWDGEDSFFGMVQKDPSSVLVATVDNKVIGSMYVHSTREGRGNWTFFWRLVVAPEYQKKGIATTLLDTAEQILRSRELSEVCIFVEESNEPLKEFYAHRGWQSGGVYRSFWKKL